MRFKSAVDVWSSLLIWLAVIILVTSIFIVPKNMTLIICLFVVPVIAFILSIYFFTYYKLMDDYLYCRSGLFYEKIYYDKIKSVRLCDNMLSSMALSRKRIEIRQYNKGYFNGTTLISPINREEFLEYLVSRCYNLEKQI